MTLAIDGLLYDAAEAYSEYKYALDVRDGYLTKENIPQKSPNDKSAEIEWAEFTRQDNANNKSLERMLGAWKKNARALYQDYQQSHPLKEPNEIQVELQEKLEAVAQSYNFLPVPLSELGAALNATALRTEAQKQQTNVGAAIV